MRAILNHRGIKNGVANPNGVGIAETSLQKAWRIASERLNDVASTLNPLRAGNDFLGEEGLIGDKGRLKGLRPNKEGRRDICVVGWNCRGLCSTTRNQQTWDEIVGDADVVALQETQLNTVPGAPSSCRRASRAVA